MQGPSEYDKQPPANYNAAGGAPPPQYHPPQAQYSSPPPQYAAPGPVEYGQGAYVYQHGASNSQLYPPVQQTSSQPGLQPPPNTPPPQMQQYAQHPSQPGLQPPPNTPPPQMQGYAAPPPNYPPPPGAQQPYQGLAPPPGQVQSVPGIAAAPPSTVAAGPQVNVVIQQQQVVAYSPLTYSSGFTAVLKSSRHHKFVSLNSQCNLSFSDHPTMWNFLLTPERNSYYITCPWLPQPGKLQVKEPPTPIFLIATRTENWAVERFFGCAGSPCTFYLESHGGHYAIRNHASGQYVSAEDHGLRANRKEYKDWEKFEIQVVRADLALTIMHPFLPGITEGVPLVDPVTTYHVNFRARIRSLHQSEQTLGRKHDRVVYDKHDNEWEFIHHPNHNAYFIRSADDTDMYWCVSPKKNTLHLSKGRHDVECAFEVDFQIHHFFFKSCAVQRFGSAEWAHVVFNRENKGGWEAFSIDIIKQIE